MCKTTRQSSLLSAGEDIVKYRDVLFRDAIASEPVPCPWTVPITPRLRACRVPLHGVGVAVRPSPVRRVSSPGPAWTAVCGSRAGRGVPFKYSKFVKSY